MSPLSSEGGFRSGFLPSTFNLILGFREPLENPFDTPF
jgi:hypothetical protein